MRVVAISLFMFVVGVSAQVAAYCRSTTIKPVEPAVCSSTGVPLQWFDRCAEVKLFPRAKPGLAAEQIAGVVQASFDTWNAVRCDGEPVGLVADVTAAQSQANEISDNAVFFVDDADEWRERMNPESAVAVTAVVFGVTSGRIRAADIEINDWAYNLGICGAACRPGVTDLQNALTHEVGHFYGLGHMPLGSPATMEERAEPGETDKRVLDPDDIAGICAVYPPGTFPEECTGSAFYAEDDSGCGCTAIGALRPMDVPWGLGMVVVLFVAWLRARQRARA